MWIGRSLPRIRLWLVGGIQLATLNSDPLLHTQQAAATPGTSIGHPTAPVDHLQAQPPGVVPKHHLDARPASVLEDVRQAPWRIR